MGKTKCDDCKKEKRIRNIIYYKGRYLCTNCLNKEKSLRESISITNRCQTLDMCLDKTYKIKGYFPKKGSYHGVCSFPRALIGKTIKIKLAKKVSEKDTKTKCKEVKNNGNKNT